MLPKQSIPCSVLILTRNSGKTLEQCLKNLAPFGEILVRDGNSEDNTVEIAKRYGARILPQYEGAEKSVRITDFTEIQLRQRADAKHDWVLYVDSDEYLSDEVIEEIGAMINANLPLKTIIKLKRYPILDGHTRTRGLYCPEVVPRIHNRTSGCTLKSGKTVHEKYVYDDTFTEVVPTGALYYGLDPIADLLNKDLRYIQLEIQRIHQVGYKWSHYVRWMLLREPLIMLSLIGKIIGHIPQYGKTDALPFAYEWRYVRYHWRLFWAMTGVMMARSLSGGRIKE